MQVAARLSAIIELVAQFQSLLESGRKTPIDATIAKYFREHRYIGSHDRGEISGLFYFIIRHYESLHWWAKHVSLHPTARVLTLAGAIFYYAWNAAKIKELCSGERFCPAPINDSEEKLLAAAEGKPIIHPAMPLEAQHNLPEWLVKRIMQHYGEHAPALLAALQEEAATDIRVNTLKATHAEVIAALKEAGISASPAPYAPDGLRLRRRAGLFALPAFQQGWFEVQDAGSQYAASLVAAKAGDRVIDFCAGAGGKTLAIAAAMQGKGRIIALDVSELRMKDLAKRLKRADVQNTEIKLIKDEGDDILRRHKQTADWVLVDAPCTGSGTWRRNPDMKRRTTKQDLYELTQLQQRILTAASELIKKGGKLVYATCSLLPEENAAQVQTFLMAHPEFQIQPVQLGEDTVEMVQLLPHIHHTDGFFACVLERIA
jgi:16S rRNA (cytosine967-C5)-methyltransferase